MWDYLTELKVQVDDEYKRPENEYPKIRRLIQALPDGSDEVKCAKEIAEKIFRMSLTQYKSLQEGLKKSVESRNERVTPFSFAYVRAVALDCSRSMDPIDWCIALQLSCGMRYIECTNPYISCFEPVHSTEIIQSGFAKDHKKRSPMHKTLLFIDTDVFMTLLSKWREWARGKQPKPRVGRYTKRYFPVSGRGGTHTNRALYAACWNYIGRGEESPAITIKKVLGHEGMATAPHYMHVLVDGNTDHIGGKWQFAEFQGQRHVLPRPLRRHGCPAQTLEDVKSLMAHLRSLNLNCSRRQLASLGVSQHVLYLYKQNKSP